MKNRKTIDEGVAIKAVKKMLHNGSGNEAALQHLRDCNYSQIDSIKVMRSVLGVNINEAKELIHYSRTWQDRRAADESIHEAAFQAMEQIQREDPK